ncbi:MAG: bifunctional diaminohydroxyphosphoribosylaminopyrimidine deaminase/5-amino-6-(5-phosphoribosylamino)uracil reductase RibD, partial [Ignavibacteria bacterium]|nr:bifunctional diaminohydroxyphosphoribosylaminopyrimidine deaminase/5-amino-6-(5-phosphoribosylamino)uracil reductase RibD [Ignavibacteria bacterium]
KRVVIGTKDPNPRVSGRGIARLRRAGVEVTVGVREEECRLLNRSFITYMTTGYPFIHMKVASSIDGKLAGKERWISSAPSRRLVHRWRGTHDAVLVGAGTVAADNPRLTVRSVFGRDPHVVVIDGGFSSPKRSALFSPGRSSTTYLCISKDAARRYPRKREALAKRGVSIVVLAATNQGISFRRLFRTLARKGISSILVEAGADLSGRLLRSGTVDRLSLFLAPSVLGGSVHGFRSGSGPGTISALDLESAERTGTDLLLTYTKR